MWNRSRACSMSRILTPVTEQISSQPRYGSSHRLESTKNSISSISPAFEHRQLFDDKQLSSSTYIKPILSENDDDNDSSTMLAETPFFYTFNNSVTNNNERLIRHYDNDEKEIKNTLQMHSDMNNNDESIVEDNCRTLLNSLKEKCGLNKLRQLCSVLKSIDEDYHRLRHSQKSMHTRPSLDIENSSRIDGKFNGYSDKIEIEKIKNHTTTSTRSDHSESESSHTKAFSHEDGRHYPHCHHHTPKSHDSSEKRGFNQYSKYRPCTKPNTSFWMHHRRPKPSILPDYHHHQSHGQHTTKASVRQSSPTTLSPSPNQSTTLLTKSIPTGTPTSTQRRSNEKEILSRQNQILNTDIHSMQSSSSSNSAINISIKPGAMERPNSSPTSSGHEKDKIIRSTFDARIMVPDNMKTQTITKDRNSEEKQTIDFNVSGQVHIYWIPHGLINIEEHLRKWTTLLQNLTAKFVREIEHDL
ncbi:unnamed protein product [Didymodactylos carnosus]|uniref:Uncharacterized protein n=1 Tax=Didymodactylos carnosus TaxID=1234261 RepID=A0A813UCR2_9BILA|nr:unnamed protein product [Didymodactylos carnosus]CAF0905887.1 unnamed protein product [Didymodactylos carnosus]CAF3608391.1 unnamed protein product [Didymodactylos carnosus]CAF3685824.1 unnamed protein product [Didymodactylos carnosus]